MGMQELPLKAKVDSQGRITIDADVRERLGIEPGENSVHYQVFKLHEVTD